jgi:dTDP-4-dehydrorhamnose 3,5-epimerase
MMMQVLKTTIRDVKLIKIERRSDARGYFAETYSRRDLFGVGIDCEFVQTNQSLSRAEHVVRGLHFQIPPHAQAKLVRVNKGSILDVAVDIRRGSPTYGKFVTVALRAEEWTEMFIPHGFAHGFCTLEPDTEVVYKVDRYYAPLHDRGLAWDDPALAIAWPVGPTEAVLSDKDRKHPTLSELPAYFTYDDDWDRRPLMAG